MASDIGFGSYSGMPGDKILFFPGTRYENHATIQKNQKNVPAVLQFLKTESARTMNHSL
jgi:hypothetical protein